MEEMQMLLLKYSSSFNQDAAVNVLERCHLSDKYNNFMQDFHSMHGAVPPPSCLSHCVCKIEWLTSAVHCTRDLGWVGLEKGNHYYPPSYLGTLGTPGVGNYILINPVTIDHPRARRPLKRGCRRRRPLYRGYGTEGAKAQDWPVS